MGRNDISMNVVGAREVVRFLLDAVIADDRCILTVVA